MTDELRIVGRIPTLADLPASATLIDLFAVTTGRQYAGKVPDGWQIGGWDDPGAARDYFGVELEDVPPYN